MGRRKSYLLSEVAFEGHFSSLIFFCRRPQFHTVICAEWNASIGNAREADGSVVFRVQPKCTWFLCICVLDFFVCFCKLK